MPQRRYHDRPGSRRFSAFAELERPRIDRADRSADPRERGEWPGEPLASRSFRSYRNSVSTAADPLAETRTKFIAGWGALGSSWGISKSIAMTHALLLISDEPLSTDEVMAELGVSRGNANTSLRELIGWGLIRKVVRLGERREYFEAEQDVWTIFCTVARERKRREIEPALALLSACVAETKGVRGAKRFHHKLAELAEFVALANGLLDRIANSERSKVLPAILKWLK
jgi:DNA-binding transcriptional regulator GbsR (MarR family)